ncbi:MFS transporter [Sphingopyxis sp. JAI128]|uniref:MFS transporter n=1 Tax=Sphingopyxis sp. JAI128 TaxID=2723066 RepID=UPI00160C5C65|nr:MFS transporter [Sphingopyxis sp. JAI128]
MAADAIVPRRTQLLYGYGSAAFGVKDNGFSYFLLIFYNQVLGLSPALASLVLMTSLVVDAITDPAIGYASDNWRSKLGRRHPFLYAAVVPVAIFYFMIWLPPTGLGETGLFFYLLLCTIAVRISISVYEIPSTALIGELTADYDERTSMLGYRYFFGWCGGLAMSCIALLLIFRPTREHPIGILNPDGYGIYGATAVVLIVASMLISSLGTQRAARAFALPPARKLRWRQVPREVFETFRDRSFLPIFLASIFLFLIVGLTSALFFYVATFFWGLAASEIALFPIVNFASAGAALIFAPRFARRLDKKKAAIRLMVFALLWSPIPILARLLDYFPENGDPWLVPLLIGHAAIDTKVGISVGILISSMTADLVESSEIRTGRRSEGLFFASRSFTQKTMSGLGVFVAGLLLEFIGFPQNSGAGVSPYTVDALGFLIVPIVLALYGCALLCVTRYRIDRGQHEANLAVLATKRDMSGGRA